MLLSSSWLISDEILVCDNSNEAIEQYFHVVLFIMLYKMVLTFKSVDETLVCNHSSESYWAELSCDYAVQVGLTVLIVWIEP